jgi:predicted amino acid dehydrogenase
MVRDVPLEEVYAKLAQCCELAKEQGAQVVGLGAFTAVVGDGGITVSQRSPIPVTTGNSYTVATAIEGTLEACRQVGIECPSSTLAIVGATGAIGKTCALALRPRFERTILIGRDRARTESLLTELPGAEVSTDLGSLREADAVVTVTSSETQIILPEHLKPGSVVCDVARPRDVSHRVARERPDVLVIEGGVVEVPGDVDFGFDFGFPPKTAYACMCETMMLALEERPESFTVGKDVGLDQVEQTQAWAVKHGFKLAGFRSFEKVVGPDAIEAARSARMAKPGSAVEGRPVNATASASG